MKILFYLLPVLLAVFLTAGCQTDYSEEALQRAREYALDNTRLLPETARNHIRFVTPRLQTADIFSHQPMTLTEYAHIPRNVDFNPVTDPNLDTIVAQFVWTPPDLSYSVIVIGYSRMDLSYWSPLKVVLKHVIPIRGLYEIARSKAIQYVTDNMLYLTRLERIRVRTSEAEIRETQFDLEYMFEEQFESARDEWKTFLEELKKHRNRKQYSVVWKADDPKKRIVITGFGSEFDLSEWTPSCGMVIPLKKLDEYTAEITERVPGAPDESEKPAAAQKTAAVKPASAQKTAKSAKPVPQKNNAAPKKETESVKPAGREEGKP
ncbi:MAG: hypothetical protein E7055_11315 [Lentisphaerae bacterium]|nr:hypothetical protein [Lentisphaerota bacterium]